MPIIVEHQTSLAPEVTLGIHSMAVDGPGSTFVIWKNGQNIRVQRYNRSHVILRSWYTAFTTPTTATIDHVIVYPFVSGGCAIVYATTPILGPEIRFEYIDKNGTYIPAASGSFRANLDTAFPQIACATDANDRLAIIYVTINGKIMAQIIENIPQSTPNLTPTFAINTAVVAQQVTAGEKSLLSLTCNWSGNNFAALYMKSFDGNGLIRKFDINGTIGDEYNTLESFRSCAAGGANRGLPCLKMDPYSEKVFLVNPVIPLGSTNPPINLHVRFFTENLSGTIFDKIIINPNSANFKLNCLGAAVFGSGDTAIFIDDDSNSINIIHLDTQGNTLNTYTDLEDASFYTTADELAPSAFSYGNRANIGFHDPAVGHSPGTSFMFGIEFSEEKYTRAYGSQPVSVVRNLGIDDQAVVLLTNVNSTIMDPSLIPNNSLNSFIGNADLALVGGPINNLTSRQLFLDTGPMGREFRTILETYGITELNFLNLNGDGNLFDDKNGTTNNAPQIEVTIPYGTFKLTRHKIGNTVYDYAIGLQIRANNNLFLFAGIRDISTNAIARNMLFKTATIDNPLENFDAVLATVTYPDTVTTVDEFQNALGLGTALIRFKPIVAIRENSPEN